MCKLETRLWKACLLSRVSGEGVEILPEDPLGGPVGDSAWTGRFVHSAHTWEQTLTFQALGKPTGPEGP